MRSKPECPICCESRSSSRMVKCPSCSYRVCVECCRSYFASTPTSQHEMECMKCHQVWDLVFVKQALGIRWVNKIYLTTLSNRLMEKNRSGMLALHEVIPLFKEVRALSRQLLDPEISPELRRVLQTMYSQCFARYWNTVKTKAQEMERKTLDPGATQPVHCFKDACNGILSASTHWKCTRCGGRLCPVCNEPVMNNQHECSPETLKTMDVIRSECRACPSCATSISKIEGCDQMFCIKCRTAFSWRTGAVESGTIHNPHYIELVRRGEIQEEKKVDEAPMEWIIQQLETSNQIYVHQHVIYHVENVERLRNQAEANVFNARNASTTWWIEKQVQYLSGTMNLEEFKQIILKHHFTPKYFMWKAQIEFELSDKIEKSVYRHLFGNLDSANWVAFVEECRVAHTFAGNQVRAFVKIINIR